MGSLIALLIITGIIALASPIAAFWFIAIALTIGFFIAKWEDSDFAEGIRQNNAEYRKLGQKPPSYGGGFVVIAIIIACVAIAGQVAPQDLEHGNQPRTDAPRPCDRSIPNYVCDRQ